MKSPLSMIALVLIASMFSNTSSNAQESGVVAVLDVARVFKVNLDFDSKMKAIKQEAEELKAEIQSRQEVIKQRAQAVATGSAEPGSAERNSQEAEVEQEQAKLRTWARQQEARLLNNEAKIYYDTYTKMQQVVAELAKVNKISMVVRFDGSEIDGLSRPEVIKAVNRSVVYYSPSIDLTDFVIPGMGPRVADTSGQNPIK